MPRRRIIAALLALPFVGVWTAYGLAPQTVVEQIETQTVTSAIELPRLSPAPEESAAVEVVRVDSVRAGDTLSELLSRLGVEANAILDYARKDERARELLRLPIGRVFTVKTEADGRLISLRVRRDKDMALELRNGRNGLYSILLPAQFARQVQLRAGEVRSSLFGSTDDAGVPDSVTAQLVKIFATDIDFREDLRKGDRFTVVYEQYYDGAETVQAGRLLAAEFVNQGFTHRAVYFETQPGVGDYYTPSGENLRKAFLRSPVEYSRVTSGFSSSRLHPVLNSWRAHKGVDFAAPEGTPVVATSEGIVAKAGSHGGYGNVVELRHHSQYSTLYGHLSRLRIGLKPGAKVVQGEVIGYVGSTGWATGPHLHYEFRIDGVHHDPLGVALPQAYPVPERHRERFAAESASLVENLRLAARGNNQLLARFE